MRGDGTTGWKRLHLPGRLGMYHITSTAVNRSLATRGAWGRRRRVTGAARSGALTRTGGRHNDHDPLGNCIPVVRETAEFVRGTLDVISRYRTRTTTCPTRAGPGADRDAAELSLETAECLPVGVDLGGPRLAVGDALSHRVSLRSGHVLVLTPRACLVNRVRAELPAAVAKNVSSTVIARERSDLPRREAPVSGVGGQCRRAASARPVVTRVPPGPAWSGPARSCRRGRRTPTRWRRHR